MSGNVADGFAFPGLYRQWREHDLAYHEDIGDIRPWFYKRLKSEDEPRTWGFIEQNYLLRYEEFMAVRWDWFSSGLWKIPFPGSRADTANIGLEGWGVPERVKTLLKEWHDPLDARSLDGEDEDFDHDASDARGLAAAREVKRFLGEKVYLESRPFQEIVVAAGEARELDVPWFIQKYADNGW